MVDNEKLEAALAEFRPLLQSDGGDILLSGIDEASGTVEMRIVIGESACEECIIEPQMLREIVAEFFAGKNIPGVKRVQVSDPRVAGEAV